MYSRYRYIKIIPITSYYACINEKITFFSKYFESIFNDKIDLT